MSGGQPADDDAPIAEASVPSEADDLAATLEATDDADEPEWEDESQTQQPQMWLVELEIINRAAGVQTDLPRRAAVPLNSDQSQDAPEKSGEANDKLGTMPGLAPLTLPEAAPAPAIPAGPPTAEITSDGLPQPTAADAPIDLVDRAGEPSTRFVARASTEAATDHADIAAPSPASRAARNVETNAGSKPSQPRATAQAPTLHATAASGPQAPQADQPAQVEGKEQAALPALRSFPVPRSPFLVLVLVPGSMFSVQESRNQRARLRTLNHEP